MKFITIQKQELQDKTVNIVSKAFYDSDYKEVMETVNIDRLKEVLKLPPKYINITTNKYVTEQLLRAITPSYLRGSEITLNDIKFTPCKCNPQYFYKWTTSIPSKLPQHLKDAFKSYQLRGSLYNELVEWNQQRIQKANEASKFKFNIAEEFYKDIFKTFHNKLKVLSPNKKTFYEANAEILFNNIIQPQLPLTDDEQLYLYLAQCKKYTKAFGLQDCTVKVGTHHRTTIHGTTEEPVIISDSEINAEIVAHSFRKKDGRQREGYLNDDGFEVISWNSAASSTITLNSKQRENITTLKWFLSLDKATQEKFLLPGWHYCPVCGDLYHENEGCYNSLDGSAHVEELTFIPYNDNHDNNPEDEYDEWN